MKKHTKIKYTYRSGKSIIIAADNKPLCELVGKKHDLVDDPVVMVEFLYDE